jgi:hypothetical protein
MPLAAAVVAAAAIAASLGSAGPAQAADEAGATIQVSPSGQDTWSRATATVEPLGSIARAIRLARPGDRIVVQGGTYVEAAGYGAVPGRQDAPIRLQAAPGERVVLKGTLQLDGADYWRVSGINVTANPDGPRREFLVKFDGGTGWRFTNAEVWGTRGVSNLMVSASSRNGVPAGYRITGNCIHDNDATGDPFMNDHHIYLMPGYEAGLGVISRNIFFNSENGAAIKAAGPTPATGASNVLIENNTIVRSAAGVIISYGSNRVTVRRNLIGDQAMRPPAGAQWVANYRAAVVGNHVTGDGNQVSQNGVWGYAAPLWATDDSPARIARSSLAQITPAFDGTSSCSGFHPRNSAAAAYGRYAG